MIPLITILGRISLHCLGGRIPKGWWLFAASPSRAGMDGVYVNSVHLDASAVDGSGYDTADAAAKVEVRSTGVAPRTTRYGGWQVPDWNMTSPDEGITVELSPEEDGEGEQGRREGRAV